MLPPPARMHNRHFLHSRMTAKHGLDFLKLDFENLAPSPGCRDGPGTRWRHQARATPVARPVQTIPMCSRKRIGDEPAGGQFRLVEIAASYPDTADVNSPATPTGTGSR